jgi:hypothetical protein
MGHYALTCKSASANPFTLLRHEKTTFNGVRDFSFVLALAEARVFKKNRFEIKMKSYSQIIQNLAEKVTHQSLPQPTSHSKCSLLN